MHLPKHSRVFGTLAFQRKFIMPQKQPRVGDIEDRPFLCAVRSAEIMEENLQQITAIPVLRRALQKTLTDLVYYKSRELKEEEME
ncbi:hypothetical protein T4D_15068 [Trichinella pseudospiralis]|uniref:Uncharacterized protein n=1 Tax=Trichinella pseudospiralis TaxID=6337 RepID=A0A0V1FLE8_TRIPS|nr:hypothetical protein T4D_15068 [Trichinella pseudospiralis]